MQSTSKASYDGFRDDEYGGSELSLRFALRADVADHLLASFALPCLAAEKLIALTFDDGPRPYVLYGLKQPGAASSANPGLLDVLDRNGVKATFFYMGWRLTPKTWGETPHETNIGVTCLDAAHDVLRRGHEIENHTYSHANLRIAERKKGEAWVLGDVERGAEAVEGRHRIEAALPASAGLGPDRRRAAATWKNAASTS